MTSMLSNKAALHLAGEQEADSIVPPLQFEYIMFGEMRHCGRMAPIMTAQLRRSAFHTSPVHRLALGCKEAGCRSSAGLRSMHKERWSGVLSSIMTEECNSIQKNFG